MDLYDIIEQAIRGHISSLLIPKGTTQDVICQYVKNIMRDNPDIFWFSHQWKYIEGKQAIRFYYTIDKEKSIKAKKQIEDVIINDFRINEISKLSILQQVMYVYKWIALYCKYNTNSAYNQTIYSVFVYRNSVCTGYAKAAQYLFKMLGIESKLVFGILHNAEKGSRHCWLVTKINGLWYHFDPTLAAPEINDLLLIAGVDPIFGVDGLVYNCFCCDTETIKLSRNIEDENELPNCYSSIDFKSVQDIPITVHRTDGAEKLGVRGCLLNDSGSSASVFLWHSENNPQCIVKVYKHDVSHLLLWHECRIMREMASSNAVLHVYGVTDNQDGLIIEQATPLADLLCCHYYRLSVTDFCKLILDVLEGVQDCLKHGIYYRDIHINNVYRTSQDHYVLGDFGSCIWIDRDNPSNIGGVASPWYTAPETYENGIFDEQSAIYGIGMLAYFLLNELYPPLWDEYGKDSLERRILGHELPAPALLKKPSCAFERKLAYVINKSLSFRSSDRYPKLSDLKKDIKQCLSLTKDNDYLLIDGGSSERHFEFKKAEVLGRSGDYTGTDFQSTCESFLEILVSNGKNETIEIHNGTECCDNAVECCEIDNDGIDTIPDVSIRNRIDDFATTASHYFQDNNTPKTYQPRYLPNKQKASESRLSFWQKIFRKKVKAIKEDEVYGSIFAPAEVKRESPMLIQVFLHIYEETEKVKAMAVESDKNAERRDFIPLHCKLKKGDKVDVLLNIYGETLLKSNKNSVVWLGKFTKCSFGYFVPKNIDVDELSCVAMLTVNGVPVGEMRFITRIVDAPRQLNPEIIAHKYNKVFISYSHQDESKVKFLHEGLELGSVPHFFDRKYLKAGDVFPQVILDYINSADLFILCWSENASQSEYVQKERLQALERAFPQVKPEQEAKLRIYSLSIEPRAELPSDMKENYHFGEI